MSAVPELTGFFKTSSRRKKDLVVLRELTLATDKGLDKVKWG